MRFFLEKEELLDELVESESLERLKQIIVYEKEAIRVDNVYSYENNKDK